MTDWGFRGSPVLRPSLARKVVENIRGRLSADLFAPPGHAIPVNAPRRSEGHTVLPINQIGKVI